jgi:hypothetical protein
MQLPVDGIQWSSSTMALLAETLKVSYSRSHSRQEQKENRKGSVKRGGLANGLSKLATWGLYMLCGRRFYASPTEGNGGVWNYTIRADGALGLKIDTTNAKNDAEVYAIPLQHAIDFTIASLNTTIDRSALPNEVMEYPYTSKTQKQRNDDIRFDTWAALLIYLQ